MGLLFVRADKVRPKFAQQISRPDTRESVRESPNLILNVPQRTIHFSKDKSDEMANQTIDSTVPGRNLTEAAAVHSYITCIPSALLCMMDQTTSMKYAWELRVIPCH